MCRIALEKHVDVVCRLVSSAEKRNKIIRLTIQLKANCFINYAVALQWRRRNSTPLLPNAKVKVLRSDWCRESQVRNECTDRVHILVSKRQKNVVSFIIYRRPNATPFVSMVFRIQISYIKVETMKVFYAAELNEKKIAHVRIDARIFNCDTCSFEIASWFYFFRLRFLGFVNCDVLCARSHICQSHWVRAYGLSEQSNLRHQIALEYSEKQGELITSAFNWNDCLNADL